MIGEEKMFMPSVEKAEIIFHNAIADGMTGFAYPLLPNGITIRWKFFSIIIV